jgi:hypothetical protein
MRLFTVHEPAEVRARDARAAERIVLVKDGLCWPGLFIPVIWMLFRRLWLGLLLYVLAMAAVGAAAYSLEIGENAERLLFLLPNVWVWLEGNDLRRRKLARVGFVQSAAVLGKSREDAEQRFFAAWTRASASPVAPASTASAFPLRAADTGVLGVFPEPGGLR